MSAILRRPSMPRNRSCFITPSSSHCKARAAETILNIIEASPAFSRWRTRSRQQSATHENDPTQPNWVTIQPGQDWRTGQPTSNRSMYGRTRRSRISRCRCRTHCSSPRTRQAWRANAGVCRRALHKCRPSDTRGQPDALRRRRSQLYRKRADAAERGLSNTFDYDPSTSHRDDHAYKLVPALAPGFGGPVRAGQRGHRRHRRPRAVVACRYHHGRAAAGAAVGLSPSLSTQRRARPSSASAASGKRRSIGNTMATASS